MAITESKTNGPVLGLGGFPTAWQSRDRSWVRTVGYPNVALPINPYTDSRISLKQVPVKAERTDYSLDGTSTSRVLEWISGYDLTALRNKHNEIANLINARHRTDSSMLNEAQLKALGKIADAKTNLAVMFAEKAKTSDLILGKANQIYRAYRSFRRGNLRQVARTLNISPRSVHKTWLEYKYGWMPLLMDVKNSAEFFAQQTLGGRPPRFTVTQSITSEATYEVRNTDNTYSVGSWYGWLPSKGVKTIKVKIECEITNPHFNQLQQLGLTNPALVAWELIPFSFVFDWFISVGSYLNGLTALHGVTVRRSMSSRLHDIKSKYVSHAHPAVHSRYFNGNLLGYRHGYDLTVETWGRSYERNPLVVDPLSLYPPVDLSAPSRDRLISGLALLRAQGMRL